MAANDLQFNGQMTLIQGGCFYTHISFMISFYFLLTMSIFNRKQFKVAGVVNNRIITTDEGAIAFPNNKGLHTLTPHNQQLKYSFSFESIIL